MIPLALYGRRQLGFVWGVSSVGLEHYLDKVGVTGSSPVRPTSKPPASLPYSKFWFREAERISKKPDRKAGLLHLCSVSASVRNELASCTDFYL